MAISAKSSGVSNLASIRVLISPRALCNIFAPLENAALVKSFLVALTNGIF
jgi:DNA-binding IscR family transcriptional regulator